MDLKIAIVRVYFLQNSWSEPLKPCTVKKSSNDNFSFKKGVWVEKSSFEWKMHNFELKRLESKRTRARAKVNHKSIVISLTQPAPIFGLVESVNFLEIFPHSRQHTVLLQHRMSTSRLFRGCFIKMFNLWLCFDLEMAWAVAGYWM